MMFQVLCPQKEGISNLMMKPNLGLQALGEGVRLWMVFLDLIQLVNLDESLLVSISSYVKWGEF